MVLGAISKEHSTGDKMIVCDVERRGNTRKEEGGWGGGWSERPMAEFNTALMWERIVDRVG
jgi:hypothetical protein